MLIWKRYVNNKMAAMRIMSLILHLQQYSHGLNLLYVFFVSGVAPSCWNLCHVDRKPASMIWDTRL